MGEVANVRVVSGELEGEAGGGFGGVVGSEVWWARIGGPVLTAHSSTRTPRSIDPIERARGSVPVQQTTAHLCI